jgi:hypothetical protein
MRRSFVPLTSHHDPLWLPDCATVGIEADSVDATLGRLAAYGTIP